MCVRLFNVPPKASKAARGEVNLQKPQCRNNCSIYKGTFTQKLQQCERCDWKVNDICVSELIVVCSNGFLLETSTKFHMMWMGKLTFFDVPQCILGCLLEHTLSSCRQPLRPAGLTGVSCTGKYAQHIRKLHMA